MAAGNPATSGPEIELDFAMRTIEITDHDFLEGRNGCLSLRITAGKSLNQRTDG